MQSAATELSEDPVAFGAEVLRLQDRLAASELQRERHEQALKDREEHIQQLLYYITLLKRKRFGPSADRIPEEQLKLFDEAELEALIGELQEALEQPSAPQRKPAPEQPKAKPVRRPLEDLPRMECLIDLPEADKQAMGSDWTHIGYDESEQLVVIAPRAAQILPRAIAHGSLIAEVVVGKFVDALALYRQEKIFAREGIDISRQTMAGWMIQLDEKLTPLMAATKNLLYQGRVIHIDETRLQELQEPGREATQQSFMWLYRGGPPEKPVVWFQYAETRSGEVPRQFLFPGGECPPDSDPPPSGVYVLTDGYSGFNALADEAGIAGHGACFAHVRRKFVEAAAGRKNTAAAHQMVALIGQLYAVQHTLRDNSPAEREAAREAAREARSKPIL